MSTLYVAEVGSTHKGNISLACELARQLKQAGADIIKFQFGHKPDDGTRRVSEEFAHTVKRYCDDIGLEMMASIFSHAGLELARALNLKRYKIAAPGPFEKHGGTPELVDAILADNKETFISLTEPSLVYGLGQGRVKTIFTVSEYPTYPWDIRMPEFNGDLWYGYSDHCHGLGACLLAVARGAQYVEKHVCIDKSDLWTKDTSFSATPVEFADLVRLGREIEQVRHAAV